MFKAQEIIRQLQRILPVVTDAFTDNVGITTITQSGLTASVTTATPHGLSTGDYATIKNAKAPISVVSITRIGDIATVVTATDHDYTKGFEMVTEITGANEVAYNGAKSIVNVPNRRTFTYKVLGNPPTPATGTIYALDNLPLQGYNGRQLVTVTSPVSFDYTLSTTIPNNAQGTPLLRINPRISGAVTIDKAILSYTKQGQNKLWAFVVLGDPTISKDRQTTTDANKVTASGDDQRQHVICPFSIFVITPTTGEISGRYARDLMEDVGVALYKSILRFKPTSVLTAGQQYNTTFVRHGFLAFADAYYVPQCEFETITDITYPDTTFDDFNHSFRDIHIDYLNPFETDNANIIMTSDIDLDEQPL